MSSPISARPSRARRGGSDHDQVRSTAVQRARADLDRERDSGAKLRNPLSAEELELIDGWWRAANYLSVGQIYLLDNPLLREPLAPEHIKPRLLGHWGTTPGLNFVYAHMNRAIRARDLNAIFVTGPGHGGPGLVANTYLEGTYTEVYPHIGHDAEGLRRLFRQFSFPGGIPSHVAPGDAGIDPRGRRARLLAAARLRRRASTTRICSRCASSATARPRPARWRRAGIRTSSSTRRTDGAVLPGPPPQRLQDRQSDGARPDPARRAARRCWRATATRPGSSRAQTRRRCIS